MKHDFLLSAVLLVAAMFGVPCSANADGASAERPKLVVGIAVDQMRWDYLYRYNDLYGDGGFKRLMREGFNCENTMINYVPSVTAIGHTSLFTGSVPSIHGIAGNSFFKDGKMVYCCEDKSVNSVGSKSEEGQRSPRNLLSTTIGDELKVATNFTSKVYGVALKDRAAIFPAGHAADGAFWMDYSVGHFVTSDYYMKQLPKWLVDYNNGIGKVTKDEICYSPLGNKLTEELAKAVIEGEKLGQGTTSDMLTVSFSCTDLIGHKYGTHSDKTREIYVDLDQRLADLFSFLDKTIGQGQYLVFLSADHGAANNILMLQQHGIPADGFFVQKVAKELDAHLQSKFGTTEKIVSYIENYQVFLDHKKIEALSLDLNDVKKAVIEHLSKDQQFAYVVDFEHVREATVPSVIREKIINGYNRFRSGDIQLIVQPGYYEVWDDVIGSGTTHGLWNPYDAHLPFLLMGWHVEKGTTQAKVNITDIAATICALIHVQMPNGCIGTAVTKVTH